jgi:NAD(P)H-hydrate epimerase
MVLATPEQMRELDDKTIKDYGIPGIVLMENAAAGVCEEIVWLASRCDGGNSAPHSPSNSSYRDSLNGILGGSCIRAPHLAVNSSYRDSCNSMLYVTGSGTPHRIGVLFLCGKGNNGGDGFAAARRLYQLMNKYANVCLTDGERCAFVIKILILAERGEIKGDAEKNLNICEKLDMDITYADAANISDVLDVCLKSADIVVDGIFGTGFRGAAAGGYEAAIKSINSYRDRNVGYSGEVFADGAVNSGSNRKFKALSIDTPSGLDTSSGRADGACIKADVTVALGLIKIGLITGKDAGCAGRVICRDIGIPEAAIRDMPFSTHLVTDGMVRGLLKGREKDSHKGDYGRVMIITGSPGMTGAGCLTAEAALRTGAGLVYLAVPGGIANIYESGVREAITLGVGGRSAEYFGADGAREALAAQIKADVIAIGPGMSVKEGVAEAVAEVLAGARAATSRGGGALIADAVTAIEAKSHVIDAKAYADGGVEASRSANTLVIDADALNAISKDLGILNIIRGAAILTPHEGEMARLIGVSAEAVHENRLVVARDFAKKYGVVLVLKGHRTIVALPSGMAYVNPTGNPGMATAGAGDVLTGMLAALAASGLDAGNAAIAAVYLHGLAGDMAAERLGETSVIAGDIVMHIAPAIKSL